MRVLFRMQPKCPGPVAGRKGRSGLPTGGRGTRNFGGITFRSAAAPAASSLKALPAKSVQDFLAAVQECKVQQAQELFHQVRTAVGARAKSKEVFGGLRALLHYLLETYANLDKLDQAVGLLEELRHTEVKLVSAGAFNAMLRGLVSRSSFEKAQWLVRSEMPRFGHNPNEGSLNMLMDSAARSGPRYLDEAFDILEEMQLQDMSADKYTVSILTKHLSDRISDKRRVPRGVMMVERFLQMQPEDVDEVLVNSLLDVFCKLGDMSRLEETLALMKRYGIKGSAVTYGTIVKAYGHAGNIDRVVEAWAEMHREGLEANAVTYGCMLDACVKCGHLDKALQTFEIMKQRGLHRNTILYATLIKGFAKTKDPSAAMNLYREMCSEQVPCNVVVFNSLIDACVRACDLQGAAEVLQEMTATNVQPDLITFSTLIKGYCSSGDLPKAMRLQEELQARHLECDEIVYNSLLEGCVKAGDLQLGLRMFSEMRHKHVRPSAVTFSILVKLLSHAGRLDLAVHLVAKEMRQIHGVQPTRMVWSCLITSCLKSRDLNRAVMALELLDSDAVTLGTGGRASMYGAVLEASLARGEVGTALQLIDFAFNRAHAEEACSALSVDLLRRVFETAGMRGLEADAQQVLIAIAHHIESNVQTMLRSALETASRQRPRQGDDETGGFARSVLDDSHVWSQWEPSYPSTPFMQEPMPPMPRCGAEAWDPYGNAWQEYSNFFHPPSAWPDAAAVTRSYPWSQQPVWNAAGWGSGRGAELLESVLNIPREVSGTAQSDFEDPLTPALCHAKAVEDEFTPVTTAGKSSACGSSFEEGYGDDVILQKVLFSERTEGLLPSYPRGVQGAVGHPPAVHKGTQEKRKLSMTSRRKPQSGPFSKVHVEVPPGL